MKINLISTKEILDFENELGHELVVNVRPAHYKAPKYYVTFDGGEVKDGDVLVGVTGNGSSIDEAITDYCNQVSGRIMVFWAFSESRTEIELPKLIHTKFLNQ